jgi:sigma-B regulation protein RsbU (phosphoserine phosphatase)
MVGNSKYNDPEPKIFKTFLDDMNRVNIRDSFRNDWNDLKEFFLTEQRKKKLQKMGRIRRWMYTVFWLLKTLIFRLTPFRRILLLFSFIFILIPLNNSTLNQNQNGLTIAGLLLLLFILMLELKDKLLAKQELEAGRVVQQALLPETGPVIPGWEIWLSTSPAYEIGGDLVDYIPYDRHHSLVLADVSGKGLAAALFMAKLQATIRALVAETSDLTTLGRKINAIFYRDTRRQSFASLLLIKLGTVPGKLTLLNAGHLPPLLVQNTTINELPKGSSAIGLSATSVFEEHEISLQPGEVFIGYTDGLTEARNMLGEFFGDDRLKKILSRNSHLAPAQLAEKIFETVNLFVKDSTKHDDLSLLIIKRIA